MFKCKDNNMALLYAMLISRIFNVFSILWNMCAPGLDKLLWQKKKTLHKFNGMWLYGTVDDDEDGEEPPQMYGHVQQLTP